jgi:uncharacterized protein (TIGR00369 family)
MNPLYPPGSGVAPPEVLKSLAGLEFMQRLVAGEIPPPPIAVTLDFNVVSVERGVATFEGRPGAKAYNPLGLIHGGYAATLLDSCMGCAVMTHVEAGMGYVTLELKVSYLRAMSHTTGVVRAIGRTLHVGRRSGFAEGEIVDSTGRRIAHGTTTCLVYPL